MIHNCKLKPLSKKESLKRIRELEEDLRLIDFQVNEKKLKTILKKVGSLSEASIKTRNEERNEL